MRPTYDLMLDEMYVSLGDVASTAEQQRFAIAWLCRALDDVTDRLAKLEQAQDAQLTERLERLERET